MSREAAFIAGLRQLASHPAARNLEDDCAVLDLGNETLILTHDMLLEGTHYLPGADMSDVAWKLLATNLSDLAAKGATPFGVLTGYALGDSDEWDAAFVAGLGRALDHFGVALLGVAVSSSALTLGRARGSVVLGQPLSLATTSVCAAARIPTTATCCMISVSV